jgi:hypothetical protein
MIDATETDISQVDEQLAQMLAHEEPTSRW